MSSTRGGSIERTNQSRFCSSTDYNQELNGLVVAKRTGILQDDETRRLIWFLQERSLRLKGMARLAEEFLRLFPDEVGLPDGVVPSRQSYSGRDLRTLFDRIPPLARVGRDRRFRGCEWIEAARRDDPEPRFSVEEIVSFLMEQATVLLAGHLLQECIDPQSAKPFEKIWYLSNPLSALQRYRTWAIQQASLPLAETTVSAEIFDVLQFCQETESMVLAEGGVRIGKSWALKAWCGMNPGLARYVEVPSTNDDRSFYIAVAEALGVANGTAYTGQQVSGRIVEMLRQDPVMLVLDEAAYLWPQKNRPTGVPPRILWIKTLHDMGVPIALVGTTEFTRWQQVMVNKTGWSDGQFKGRIALYRRLPDLLGEEDLRRVAMHLLPGAAGPTIDYLVGFALTSSAGAAAIAQALKAARYRAKRAGRLEIEHEDVENAVLKDALPSENALAKAMSDRRGRGQPKVSGEVAQTSSHVCNAGANCAPPTCRLSAFATRQGGNH